MMFGDMNNNMSFRPSDFDNEKYKCVNCFNRKDKPPVLVMASNSSNPPYYLITYGNVQIVYRKYSDVINYLEKRGLVG